MYEEFMPYVNVTEGLNRVMNMKKLYVKLLRSFLGTINMPQITETALALKDGGDRDAARGAAHALKGVTANLSINQCYDRAAKLEIAVKNDEPFAVIEPLLTDLQQCVTQTLPMVERLITVLES